MRGAGQLAAAPPPPLLWLDGGHTAAQNMARDAALLEAIATGAQPGPVLRLYQFAPPGITLGRAQDPGRELDLAAVERDGVPWAMRPTGGGAIWHERAWTLSLAGRLGPGGWAGTPRAAYARTSELLLSALRSLGVPAEAATRAESGSHSPRSGAVPAEACFARSARHEVHVGGRKLAGIAQRVSGHACLQQANVLLGDAHTRLALYANVPAADRPGLARDWARRAIGAERWLGSEDSLERLGAALARALGEHRALGGEEAIAALGLDAAPRPSA